jgi:hypothetical protein
MSCDGPVSNVTDCWMDGQGLLVAGAGIFIFATASRPAPEATRSHMHCIRGVKQSEHEAGHSTPSSAVVQNACVTSAPSLRLHGEMQSHKGTSQYTERTKLLYSM